MPARTSVSSTTPPGKARRQAGWTPEQLVEAFAYFAIAVYSAYFTNFAATELDVPSVLPTQA